MDRRHPMPELLSWDAWRDMGISLVLAVCLAALCHATVAEARFIPSGSMLPTLHIGDRVLIEKISYHLSPPKRGDIVVFQPPRAVEAFGYDNKIPWIKRVIGLPGETVAVEHGHVYINGQAIQEDYIQSPPRYDMPARHVPAGAIFVLGDNRNHSIDSHIWGCVSLKRVIGRASFRFWPLDHLGDLGDSAPVLAARPQRS